MSVLITGGSGFTGQRIIPRLVVAGHEVVGLARSSSAATIIGELGASPVNGDLDDPESLDAAFAEAKAAALVNVASLGFGHAPALIAASLESGINRAVFVSTTAIFTHLRSSSKRARVDAERQVQFSGLDWTIIRPTMIYGAPGDRNMSRLLTALRRAPVFPLPGGGTRLQQPVHVEDLADAIVTALSTDAASEQSYDVAGPNPLTFRQIVEQAASAVGRSPTLVPVPLIPAVGAIRLYERLARHPRLKSEQLERLAEDKAFDVTPARRDLAYAPRSFLDGITAEAALFR